MVLQQADAGEEADARCVGWSVLEVKSLHDFLIGLGVKPRDHPGFPRVYVLHEDAASLLRDDLRLERSERKHHYVANHTPLCFGGGRTTQSPHHARMYR